MNTENDQNAPSSTPNNTADPSPNADDQPKTTPKAKAKPSAKTVHKKAANAKKAAKTVKKIKAEAELIPKNYELAAKKRRKKRTRRLIQKFTGFVILPTLVATVYFLFFAVDQYESVSAFIVQSSESKSHVGLDSIIGTIGASGASTDAMTIKEFILSRDMLTKLDDKLNYIAHFKTKDIDPLARLAQDATFEDAYEFYTDHVNALYDTESRVLSLHVKAFDPELARQFSLAILNNAEQKVNMLSDKMQQDQIRFAARSVEESEKRLKTARQNLLKIQREQDILNPGDPAAGVASVKFQLESELAKVQTELAIARSKMTPTAPIVRDLSQRAQSLRQQIKQENKKVLGQENGSTQSPLIDFESTMMEKEFAQQEYEASMSSLKFAKLEAMKQSRYLAVIAEPSAPDKAAFPQRGINILTVFLSMLAVFGMLSLLGAAIREHARI